MHAWAYARVCVEGGGWGGEALQLRQHPQLCKRQQQQPPPPRRRRHSIVSTTISSRATAAITTPTTATTTAATTATHTTETSLGRGAPSGSQRAA